jgi:hypothetical protein
MHKAKKTQTIVACSLIVAAIRRNLMTAGLSDNILSAHSTIAEFCGVDDHVAKFMITKYLRYAFLQENGQGMQQQFYLDLKTADEQSKELAEEQEETLSAVVAEFSAKDRVELDWIEIKLGRRVVTQVQNLGRISRSDEKMLNRQYPEPQIMSRKVEAKINFAPAPSTPAELLCLPCAPANEGVTGENKESERNCSKRHRIRTAAAAILAGYLTLRCVV